MRTWARRSLESTSSSLRGAALRLRERGAPIRVGWVAADSLVGGPRRLSRLHSPVSMRIANTAFWINAHSSRVRNELYRPGRSYDVVVFFKAMDRRAREEAERVQAYGGRVVFDANVNYYEVWGDYDLDGTRPTDDQQADAAAMTELADWVVADSWYLLGVVHRLNERASWIPDNVDVRLYRGTRRHVERPLTRLVWSGISWKAAHLLEIADGLASLRDAELVLVSEAPPPPLTELQQALPCRFVRYSEGRYAATLRRCDVIVSPKRLANAYEMAHTEYKITLGMAVGLPAVASPQPSYVEAVEHHGGGVIAETAGDWRTALEQLCGDPELRAELGARARQTVHERYSTPVLAREYLELVTRLAG